MKKYIVLLLSGISSTLLPAVVFAQEAAANPAGPATFAGSITLWIAVVIGFIASIMTINFAFQMSGSTVGDILRPLGFGMLIIVLGFLCVVVPWADAVYQKILHDLLFISAYIMMLIGVARMRRLSV